MPRSTRGLSLPIKGLWGGSCPKKCRVLDNMFESVWICCGLYKYQTCLIFLTAVTNPLSPLPTNSPVSAFLRPPGPTFTKSYAV